MIRTKLWMVVSGVAVLALASCGPATGPNATPYANQTTYSLWSQLESTADTKQIMLLEAELASRGETQSYSGREYIGRRTSGTVGRSSYGRTTEVSGDRNCSDFASPAAAQKFFLSQGGPVNDPHGLDRDGDGNACEWGKSLRSSVASHRQYVAQQTVIESRARARVAASSRCYVGPRGGTYTITASGNKNYGGC